MDKGERSQIVVFWKVDQIAKAETETGPERRSRGEESPAFRPEIHAPSLPCFVAEIKRIFSASPRSATAPCTLSVRSRLVHPSEPSSAQFHRCLRTSSRFKIRFRNRSLALQPAAGLSSGATPGMDSRSVCLRQPVGRALRALPHSEPAGLSLDCPERTHVAYVRTAARKHVPSAHLFKNGHRVTGCRCTRSWVVAWRTGQPSKRAHTSVRVYSLTFYATVSARKCVRKNRRTHLRTHALTSDYYGAPVCIDAHHVTLS